MQQQQIETLKMTIHNLLLPSVLNLETSTIPLTRNVLFISMVHTNGVIVRTINRVLIMSLQGRPISEEAEVQEEDEDGNHVHQDNHLQDSSRSNKVTRKHLETIIYMISI